MKTLQSKIFSLITGIFLIGSLQSLNAQTSISGSSITLVGKDRAATTGSGNISVSLPSNIQPGDVTFLFLGQSDASDLQAPSGWTRIVTKGPDDINQEALYRIYQSGQSTTYTFGGAKNKFVSVVTLRGVDNNNPVRAQWNGKDTDRGGESTCSSGHRGRAKATTSIATASNGVRFLTCMFDDPFIGEVFTSSSYSTRVMTILDAWKNGDDALMVAIEGTNGSGTANRYIQGSNCATGGGNDIVFSITINPGGSTPPPPPTGEVVIDFCESISGWSSSNNLVRSGTKQEGNYSIKTTGSGTNDFSKNFATKDAGNNNTLSFWYYVSDKSLMNSSNQVELGSAGGADANEFNWSINTSDLQNGWNKIELPFSDAGTTGGAPNLSQLNWFRLYRFKSGSVISRVDDIRLISTSSNRTVVKDNNANTPSVQSFVTEQVDNFQIFPNPSNGYFKLLLNNPEDAATIRMFDMQGRVVLEQVSNAPVATFDVSNLAKGVYAVNVTNKQGSKNIQLVVR
jgi:hypothetical protein